MNEKYQKYLPIGTVVLLKEAKKRVMIMGYCQMIEEDKTKVFDYSAVLYPEGYLSPKQVCLFNHEQIGKIFCLGYSDDEDKQFKIKLNDIVKEIEKNKSEQKNDFLNN